MSKHKVTNNMSAKKSRVANFRALFRSRTKEEDNNELTLDLIISARKTGELSLASKGLFKVPERVWTLSEMTKEELKKLCVKFDCKKRAEETRWWELEQLKKLDLSTNSLTEIDSQIERLCDLEDLDLHENSLVTLPESMGSLNRLLNLNVSHNRLRELPDGLYKLEMKKLDLNHNTLEKLSRDVGDLIMLEILDLSHNNLSCLPVGMGYLVRLETIDLSHNKLKKLPADITSMRALIKLNVCHNQLEETPAFGEMKKLQVLLLDNNSIKKFPEVNGCSALRELYLSNNSIPEIDAECIEGLTQLRVLTLKFNRIEVIPEEVFDLINLESFELSNNKITVIPKCIGIMPNLKNLQLEGNNLKNVRSDILRCGTARVLKHLREGLSAIDVERREHSNLPCATNSTLPDKYAMKHSKLLTLLGQNLTEIPETILEDAAFAEVTCVDFSRNVLTTLPEKLSLVESVTDLKVSVNRLAEIPDWIDKLKRLQFLELSKNKLTVLPASVANLAFLKEICISCNKFTEIPTCLYEITHLEILNASDNQINNIDAKQLTKLKRLGTLDLSNNNINFVPPELGNMRQLRNLMLSGNSFKQPRQTTLAKGTEEILYYLRNKIPVQ